MRTSKRTKILEAAVNVITADGVTAISYEAVAEAAGMTKSGLLYHFPSRESLLIGLNEYLADQWNGVMSAHHDAGSEELDDQDRLSAYLNSMAHTFSRAELLLMLESVQHPQLHATWRDATDAWAPSAPEEDASPAEYHRFVARLAADGFWLYEAVTDQQLTDAQRQRILSVLKDIAASTTAVPHAKPGRGTRPTCQD